MVDFEKRETIRKLITIGASPFLGGFFQQISHFAEAEDQLEEQDSEKARNLLNEGDSYYSRSNNHKWMDREHNPGKRNYLRQALRAYIDVKRLGEDTPEGQLAQYKMGLCYMGLGEVENKNYYRAGLNTFWRFKLKYPDHTLIPDVNLQIANHYLNVNNDSDVNTNVGEAFNYYRTIIQTWPNSLAAREAEIRCVLIKYEHNDFVPEELRFSSGEEAIECLENILPEIRVIDDKYKEVPFNENDTTNIELLDLSDRNTHLDALGLYLVGYIQYWRGKGYVAINTFRDLVTVYDGLPDHDLLARSFLFIGHIREMQNQYDLAAETYKKALDDVPYSKLCCPTGEIRARLDRVYEME